MLDWELDKVNSILAKDVDKKKAAIHENIIICRKVAKTLKTEGWQRIIEPMMARMIEDIVGGKVNGKWKSGLISTAKKDEKREYYIGYKQALIDLWNRIAMYEEQLQKNEKMLERIQKNEEKSKTYKQPLEESPYL